jgi:hypothetical protein
MLLSLRRTTRTAPLLAGPGASGGGGEGEVVGEGLGDGDEDDRDGDGDGDGDGAEDDGPDETTGDDVAGAEWLAGGPCCNAGELVDGERTTEITRVMGPVEVPTDGSDGLLRWLGLAADECTDGRAAGEE